MKFGSFKNLLIIELVVIRLSPINVRAETKGADFTRICAQCRTDAPFTSAEPELSFDPRVMSNHYKPLKVPQHLPVWRLSLPIGRRHPYHKSGKPRQEACDD